MVGRKKGRAGGREERKKDGGKGEKEKERRKKKARRREGRVGRSRGGRRETQFSWHCAMLELMNSVSNTPMQI